MSLRDCSSLNQESIYRALLPLPLPLPLNGFMVPSGRALGVNASLFLQPPPPHLGQGYVSGRHRLSKSHLAEEEAFGAEQRRGAVAGRAHGAALG